jgi:hypothetical protein
VYVCARVRVRACVRACVQALQVCMPTLVCKCRHVCAFVPCGAQDVLDGTLLVLMIPCGGPPMICGADSTLKGTCLCSMDTQGRI